MSASKATQRRWKSARLAVRKDMIEIGLDPDSKADRDTHFKMVFATLAENQAAKRKAREGSEPHNTGED